MRGLIVFLFIICGIQASATEYYVSTKGSNSNDGLSESSSFNTLSYAASKARSGDIVWIKAGNYGAENVVFKYNGGDGSLISFIGYKNSPGDIDSNYFSYQSGHSLNADEMPLFDGGNRAEGIGLKLYGRSYVQIKNVQITNYRYGIDALSGANNLIIDNVVVSNAGGTSKYAPISGGNCIRMDTNTNHHNKIVNSVVLNATMVAITVGGDYNLIENNKTYADQDDVNGDKRSMDYHVLVSGSNNIIRNHYAEHVGDLAHTGHGLVLKSLENSSQVENNLIENCDVVNINGSIEFRHRKVKNNIARSIRIVGTTSRYSGGFHFRDGASDNIVENSYVSGLKGMNGGISFYDTREDGGTQWSGNDNLIRNTVFKNCALGIRLGTNNTPSNAFNNKVLNCTFYEVNTMIGFWPKSINTNNVIQNSIISNSKIRYHKNVKQSGWLESNNNYENNGFSMPTGTGNVSVKSDFIDVSKGNFRLKSSSKLINAGTKIEEVKKDFDENQRPQGSSHDIGAFEYIESSTSSLKANAGEDVALCLGEGITLTASGGGNYTWSTGETTQTIEVIPTESTTYEVIVTDGITTDKDQVTVTVNQAIADAGKDVSINEGETVTLTASGGESYLWSNGASTKNITVNPEITTTYSVKVVSNGCEDEDEVKVVIIAAEEVNLQPVVANAGEDISICLGEEVNLVGSGGDGYVWSTGEKTKSIKVAPTRTTTYELEVERQGVNDLDYITVTVENCTNVIEDNIELTNNLKVYPNPASGIININIQNVESEAVLDLVSLTGNVIYSDTMQTQQSNFSKQIDLSSFERGVYFVRIYGSSQNLVQKIIMI